MLKSLAIVAALGLIATAAQAAPARDVAGKCRDNGKFVTDALCKAVPAPAAKCRNAKTKQFAKCGTAGAVPIPAAKK